MITYAFLLTVDGTSTKQQLKTISDAIDFYLEGRDPEPSDPTIFNRYVLKGTEIGVTVWIGVADEIVVNNVRIELTRQNAGYRQVSFNGPGGPYTHAVMLPKLKVFAQENGAVEFVAAKPGDTIPLTLTTQQLLDAFVPF